MTFIKICGITNIEDASLCVELGVDAIGFNFYHRSPRFIDPKAASAISSRLSQPILSVGVFVNETLETIVKTIEIAGLNAVQLHGDEMPEYVERLNSSVNVAVIKALRVSPDFRAQTVLEYKAFAILLDAFSSDAFGGTGHTYDHKTAAAVRELGVRLYLAGGLGPANVAEAVRRVRPYAVDACSKLESVPGKKDRTSVEDFVRNVRLAI